MSNEQQCTFCGDRTENSKVLDGRSEPVCETCELAHRLGMKTRKPVDMMDQQDLEDFRGMARRLSRMVLGKEGDT